VKRLKMEGGVPTWVATLTLIFMALVVYVPAYRAGLLWDDKPLIFNNPLIRASDGLWSFWLTDQATDYLPLTWTGLWVQWRLFGDNPAGYHAVNVALHALAAVLIWRVLIRLRVPGAWVAASIFAVHPVTAATVMWISEQKNTLSMVLLALTLVLYLRFEDTGRSRWYACALLVFGLALLAKASVVMVPAALLLLAWWRRGRVDATDLKRTAPMFAMSLAIGLVTIYFQHHHAIGSLPVTEPPLSARVAGTGWNLWFYLYKCVVPLDLSMVYPRWTIDPLVPWSWAPLAGVVAVGLAGWFSRRGPGRAALTALGCYALVLLPVLGLVAMAYHRYSFVADHLQYAGLAAPIVLLVVTGRVLLRRVRANSATTALLCAAVLIGIGGMTYQRARAYSSVESMWLDTLEHNPRAWVAYNNLGLIHAGRGEHGEAIKYYQKALEVFPDYPLAHNNLGIELATQGQSGLAVRHFRQAIDAWPGYNRAQNNLGLALSQLGQHEQAVRELRRAIEITPNFTQAHVNLARELTTLGHPDEAIDQLRLALAVEPSVADWHYQLGTLLQSTGRTDEAARQFLQAAGLRPDWVEAMNNAAWLLATDPTALDPARAVKLAERASGLTGQTNPAVLDTLAAAYDAAGRHVQAVTTAQLAVELAERSDDTDLAQQIRSRLAGYRLRAGARDE
jgi:protein O-mannosyl-transferase